MITVVSSFTSNMFFLLVKHYQTTKLFLAGLCDTILAVTLHQQRTDNVLHFFGKQPLIVQSAEDAFRRKENTLSF